MRKRKSDDFKEEGKKKKSSKSVYEKEGPFIFAGDLGQSASMLSVFFAAATRLKETTKKIADNRGPFSSFPYPSLSQNATLMKLCFVGGMNV